MSTISTAGKKKRYSLIAVAVMLVTALLGAIGINQAQASTAHVTFRSNNVNPNNAGLFDVSGAEWSKAYGICSDPILPPHPNTLGNGGNFNVYTIHEFANKHPNLSGHQGAAAGDTQEYRERWMAFIMMTVHPNLPKEWEDQLWADKWAKFQKLGTGYSYDYFRNMIVHMLLGAISNVSYEAVGGYTAFSPDVLNFYRQEIFSRPPDPNWMARADDLWKTMDRATQDKFIDSIRVANVDERGYQAVFIFYKPFDFEFSGKLSLNKTSALKEYTDGNSAYSLEGTQYGVFTDAKATVPAKVYKTNNNAVLTVGANQKANSVELKCGTYYVKEIKASSSYELDPTIHKVKICGNK